MNISWHFSQFIEFFHEEYTTFLAKDFVKPKIGIISMTKKWNNQANFIDFRLDECLRPVENGDLFDVHVAF